MAEPKLETLYERRNTLVGKWSSLMRVAAFAFVAIYAFMMLLLNFVDLKVLPLRVHLVRHLPRKPEDWWLLLAVSILTGLVVAAFAVSALAFSVRASRILIHSDRLRVSIGPFKWDLPFSCITAVETVSFVPWPRLGNFWNDLKRQIQMVLLTPRYAHTGYGQTLLPQATWVLLKVQGRRWFRGYFIDVDNPERFLSVLNEALARYRATQATAGAAAAGTL